MITTEVPLLAFAVSLVISGLYLGCSCTEDGVHGGEVPLGKTGTKAYKLYVRLPTWIKQILLTLSLISSVVGITIVASRESWTSLEVACRLTLSFTIAVVAHFDGIRDLSNSKSKLLWMGWNFFYLLFVVLFFISPLSYPGDILVLVASVVSVLVSVVNALGPVYAWHQHRPSDEYTCGWASYVTFSFINHALIKVAVQKESLDYEDIPFLSDVDRAFYLTDQLSNITRANPHWSLKQRLFSLIRQEWFAQGFFQFVGSVSGFIAPLALEKILVYVRYSGGPEYHHEGFLQIDIWIAVLLIFLGPVSKSLGDGQNYTRGRHIGIRVKAALVGLIFRKSLTVDMSASKESVGKLNNLISVDVGEIQNFCSYSHYMWSTPLEIALASSLLFIVLGRAAAAGMIVMILALAFGVIIGKRLERLQDRMLKHKDKRMAIMHEVLHSIRIIKFYAWEKQFNDKIGMARLQELAALLMYACTNIFLCIIWEIVPVLVGVVAFMMYTQALGQTLTPALGFTAITLFQLLRFPLAVFPEMINSIVKSSISLKRIEDYLQTANVAGLPKLEVTTSTTSTTAAEAAVRKGVVPSEESGQSPPLGAIRLQSVSIAWRKVLKQSDEGNEKGHGRGGSDDEEKDKAEDAAGSASWCCFMETGASGGASSQPSSSTWCCFATSAHRSLALLQGGGGGKGAKRRRRRSDGTTSSSQPPQEYQLLDTASRHGEHDNGVELTATTTSVAAAGVTNAMFTLEDDDDDNDDGNDEEESAADTRYEIALPRDTAMAARDNEAASVETGESPMRVVLHDVTLDFPPGSLVVVVGGTGSGKSSLLQGAILGEAMILRGARAATGSISYSSQSAWIQNATVRDNILFGLPYEADRYAQVVRACALEPDLRLLAAGDMTEIGEKGVNLSGGQQQRINLARAAYAQSQIVLLDDPLSAVDAHVGDHIFTQLILDLLATRTRVLATNALSLVVPHADVVVCMDASKRGVLAVGTREEVRQQLHRYVHDEESTIARDSSDNKAFCRGVLAVLDAAADAVSVAAAAPAAAAHDTASPLAVDTTAVIAHAEKSLVHDSIEETFDDLLLGTATASSAGTPANYSPLNYTGTSKAGVPTAPTTATVAVAVGTTATTTSPGQGSTITERESKSTGDVPLSTYWFYLQAAGGALVTVCLIASCIWIAFSWFWQNYCLGRWMDAMQQPHATDRPHQWQHYQRAVASTLHQYLLSVVSVVVAYTFRTSFQSLCSIRAAQRIHNQLVRSVLLAPTSWFDATPIGRIINRFSQDVSTVDSSVMDHLMGFIDCVLGTISVVCVITSVMPLLFLPLCPILLFTGWVTFQYLRLSRELKRWESIKKSPVFVLLTETLNGLNTVRAFRQEARFYQECCQRIDAMNQCHLYLWISNRWLNFRMQILGATVAGTVGAGVVYYAGYSSSGGGGHGMAAPAAGLVLLYSLNFCDNLTWLARTHAECQMDMNSVERIEEYSAVVPEKYVGDEERRAAMQHAGGSGGGGDAAVLALEKKAMIDASRVLSFAELWQTVRAGHANDTATAASFQQSQAKLAHATTNPMAPSSSSSLSGSNWPTAGKLEFKGLSMRYKSQADRPVLNGVSFAVAPREKIGVVGRTGAGKSSLIIALYRLVEPFAGQICIDDVNILSMPLYAIRSNIAIVPQEPTLFKGTLRFNLDPFREYCDEDIYEALQRVQLCDNLGLSAAYALCRQRGRGYGGQGYDAESALETFLVAEKGGNFSVGQRQLLCMARAILRKTKVLVLDECTASVDHETDALIQDIVRTQLASTTVLCIAHRLHTVAYYDKVLVMDKGEAREFDTPLSLMHQEHSIFRSLCISSGSFDQLVAIATEATVRKQQLATM